MTQETTSSKEKVKSLFYENCKSVLTADVTNLSHLSIEEIGDGNLNDVLRIKHTKPNSEFSVIAKQGPPYIKCLGPEYPLTVDRNRVEYAALQLFNRVRPGCVPKPLCRLTHDSLYFMEDLNSHNILRGQLINGEDCSRAILQLAENIASIHKELIKSKLSKDDIQTFENLEMVELTRQFVFTKPFTKDDPTNRYTDQVRKILPQIYDDPSVLGAAERMRRVFLEKKESLVHGDLHTGSVMVSADGKDPKIIDLEFAYLGPCAFDVGSFIANLIFTYYQHMCTEQDNDLHRNYAYSIVDLVKQFVSIYLEKQTEISDADQFMSEVTGFCGCEIIRRIVGTAHVEDFNGRELAEADCLGSGIRLLQAIDRIKTADRLMVIALMLT